MLGGVEHLCDTHLTGSSLSSCCDFCESIRSAETLISVHTGTQIRYGV